MAEKPQKRYPGEKKGFVEEMRFVAMKLHTRDQAKEGEKEPDTQPVAKWESSIEGYLRFFVDSKVVYDTLESIVDKAAYHAYAEFRNTGLERSDKLAKDLQWFKEQGHAIPEPSTPGTSYARYLEELSEKDPPAFICHFYNVYFAHTAGGRMIGKKDFYVCRYLLNGHGMVIIPCHHPDVKITMTTCLKAIHLMQFTGKIKWTTLNMESARRTTPIFYLWNLDVFFQSVWPGWVIRTFLCNWVLNGWSRSVYSIASNR